MKIVNKAVDWLHWGSGGLKQKLGWAAIPLAESFDGVKKILSIGMLWDWRAVATSTNLGELTLAVMGGFKFAFRLNFTETDFKFFKT